MKTIQIPDATDDLLEVRHDAQHFVLEFHGREGKEGTAVLDVRAAQILAQRMVDFLRGIEVTRRQKPVHGDTVTVNELTLSATFVSDIAALVQNEIDAQSASRMSSAL